MCQMPRSSSTPPAYISPSLVHCVLYGNKNTKRVLGFLSEDSPDQLQPTNMLPSRSKDSQETLCQKCGVTGYAELLVYCKKCQISAEHRYCLNVIPQVDDVEEEIKWSCEECVPIYPKLSSLHKTSSGLIRRIKHKKPSSTRSTKTIKNLKEQGSTNLSATKAEGKEQQTSDIVSTSQTSKPHVRDLITFPEPDKDNRGSHSLFVYVDQDGKLEKNRKLVLADHDSSSEEAEHVKGQQLHVGLDAAIVPVEPPFPSRKLYDYVHAQPIVDPIWRGCFDVGNEKLGTLVGHLSNKACLKVLEGAQLLPRLLRVEVLPRTEAWPKSFEVSQPTDESIALYFFPRNESVGKVLDKFVHDMIVHDLALKALVDNVELLIFSSHRLPSQHWRFDENFYLWGVFRGRKVSYPHQSADLLLIENGSAESVTQ